MILLIQRVPILGAPLLVVGSIIGPAEVHVGAAHDADGDVAAAEAEADADAAGLGGRD